MIKSISIDNFLGVSNFQANPMGKTVLISGPNAAGKSSIGHAIIMAIAGEMVRVPLKKQAGYLVRNGAKSATINVVSKDDTIINLKITQSGAITKTATKNGAKVSLPADETGAVMASLDMGHFIGLSPNARRSLLTTLTPWPGSQDILDRMLKRNCVPDLVESLRPMLASETYNIALSHAKTQAEQHRRNWREITGEAYGEEKAETWACPFVNTTAAENMISHDDVNTLDATLERIADEIAELKGLASIPDTMECPCCGNLLLLDDGVLVKDDGTRGYSSKEATQTSMNNLLKQQREITQEKNEIIAMLERQRQTTKLEGEAMEITAKALKEHYANMAWVHIIEALEPSGIQADLMERTLKDMNVMMAKMSDVAGFKRLVGLGSDMMPTIGNTHYMLASESERWRMNAMISIAVSRMAGLGLVLLDGLDIIEPAARLGIINLAKSLDNIQVIMMATLKQAASVDGVDSYWIG